MKAFVPALILCVIGVGLAETRADVGSGDPREPFRPAQARYEALAIVPFDATSGVEIPASYLAALSEELVAQILHTKKFRRVFLADEPGDAPGPTARLTGTITEFTKGSAQIRFWVGFGAGQAKLKGHYVVRDGESSAVVLEGDADGKVLGLNDPMKVTRGLAKEIAQALKRSLF